VDFKHTVLLDQQTPLIHFQHGEPGATIRGSELKPKLDRFMIRLLGGLDAARANQGTWFANDHQDALAYKVRLAGIGGKQVVTSLNRSYFGNLRSGRGRDRDRDRPDRYGVEYPEGVELSIFCPDSVLWAQVNKWLQWFFWTNNFGTRQSKGFGSFTVRSIDGEDPPFGKMGKKLTPILELYQKRFVGLPGFELRWASRPETAPDPLELIRLTYGFMRSGFNFPKTDDYYKGFSLMYLDGFRNDKSFIKTEVLNCGTGGAPGEARFVRAMLGASNLETWGDKDNKDNKDNKVEVHYAHQPGLIARVPSPITFSVAESSSVPESRRVFLLPRPIPDALLGTWFEVRSPQTRKSGQIQTPTAQEFDLAKFLTCFADKFNDKERDWCLRRDGKRNRFGDAESWSLRPAQHIKLDRIKSDAT
jgi:hypothetical protein